VLLVANRSRLYHHVNASGRIPRRVLTRLTLLNLALFLRRNATNRGWARRSMLVYLCRRFLAEWIKDGMSKRWSFPQVRGVLDAVRPVWQIMRSGATEFEGAYLRNQEAITASRSGAVQGC
jgi:hypothetical protein